MDKPREFVIHLFNDGSGHVQRVDCNHKEPCGSEWHLESIRVREVEKPKPEEVRFHRLPGAGWCECFEACLYAANYEHKRFREVIEP